MEALIILLSILVALSFFVVFPIWLFRHNYVSIPRQTQWKVSDKDIILLIEAQASKHITAKKLAFLTELTHSEAKKRLYHLYYSRVLTTKHSSSFKSYYHLKEPAIAVIPLGLSSGPYLSKEDFLVMFKYFGYRLSLQNICLATGMPIAVIKKDLKRLVKEKFLVRLQDRFLNLTYVLHDSVEIEKNPKSEDLDELNLDLSKLTVKEKRER